MTTTNQTNITFVTKMAAVMAAQAMQLLAIHYGYHCTLEYWTYETGHTAHIMLSMLTEDNSIEIPNGYLYSQYEQLYLEDSKIFSHQFYFNY